jgi:glycogen synthase
MRPPRTVIVTFNLVAWDGRAQKVARSLAEAGWDVWLVGGSETGLREISTLGRARVVKLPGRIPAEGWRRRHLIEFEQFDEVLDDLRPDVIHAHAVEALGLAVRVKRRAEEEGRAVTLVYDVHDYIAGVDRPDRTWRLAMLVEEATHVASADGVMTLSEPLADLLEQRYELAERPVVVTLAAERRPPELEGEGERSDVRTDCGLGPDVGLLVYPGAVGPARGLATVVAALPELEDVHFAMQVIARHQYVAEVERQAEQLGVRGRLHVLQYVAPHRIAHYVRTASAGVIPLLHTPDHDVDLCNKYFDFMQARLPMIVSDVKLQAETTARLGNGEVFRSGDVGSFAAATRTVLANRERYAAAYEAPGLLERNSWEAEVPRLLQFYERVTGLTPVPNLVSGL